MPKANHQITAHQVRLVNHDGSMMGVVPIKVALEHAKAFGLDLVEVSPNAVPPVCKVLDFGKFKYESKKKMQQSKKKQKTVEVKEIKLRPGIGDHDLEVKLKQVKKFLTMGEKVKITLKFRGREITHSEIGMEVVRKIVDNTLDIAHTEVEPKIEGSQIIAVLAGK